MLRCRSGMRVKGSTWQPADPSALYYGLPGEKRWWMWARPSYIRAHEALLAEKEAARSDLDVLIVDTACSGGHEQELMVDALPTPPPLSSARTSLAPPRHLAPRRVPEMLTT
jgi:hypothetical protein